MSSRIRNESVHVSLFPFLAVLLCTVGVLVVVLVLITRQTRANAIARAKAEQATSVEPKLAADRELIEWEIDQLDESRRKTAKGLERERLGLSNAEDHLRRLHDRLQSLSAAAEAFKQSGEQTALDREEAERELAALRTQLGEVALDIEQARKKAADQPRSYAVIPYQGPNGTYRQPIYIECWMDRVVLQPEGIRLKPNDFEPPLGPGNPLASALRASREYLVHTARQSGVQTEPYPLIIVRPEGIAAYYKVREAIQSWGTDFGYELINGEWKLEYPARDGQLAEIQQRAVDEGRMHQARLAAAAPRQYGRRTPTYRVTPHRGGVTREMGSGDYDSDTGGGSGFGSGSGTGRSGTTAGEPSGAYGTEGGPASGTLGVEGSHAPGGGWSPEEGQEPSGGGGPRFGSTGEPGSPGKQGYPGDRYSGQAGEAQLGSTNGGQAGGPGGPAQAGAGTPQSGGGTPGQLGSPSGQGGNAPPQPGGQTSQFAQSYRSQPGTHASKSSTQSGQSPGAGQGAGQAGSFKPMADTRGENWALPDATRKSTAVTRPLRLICFADRVVIVPEDKREKGKVVPFAGRTDEEIDQFVSAVWDHMKSWGIAGNGMHWRPILVLQPGPQGGTRAQELGQLLEGSGMEVRIKSR